MANDVIILYDHFPQIATKLWEAGIANVANAAGIVVGEAKSRIHYVSGELEGSIHIEPIGPLEAHVKADGGHAAFVEYGTATRATPDHPPGYNPGPAYDIFPVNANYLHFFWKGQEFFLSAVYGHPGIYSHPFMTPAADIARVKFIESFMNLERFL